MKHHLEWLLLRPATKSGGTKSVTTMSDRQGNLELVRVPVGFPKWSCGEHAPGTVTWRVIVSERQFIWLYQHPFFKTQLLTVATLDATEPCNYRRPALKSTGARAPRPKTAATKLQSAAVVATKSQAGCTPRSRKQTFPVRCDPSEIANTSQNLPQALSDDEPSAVQEQMDVSEELTAEDAISAERNAAAIVIEDINIRNQGAFKPVNVRQGEASAIGAYQEHDQSSPIQLARVQGDFIYLAKPEDEDPVWSKMSPEVLGLCLQYGALDVNLKFEVVDLYVSA